MMYGFCHAVDATASRRIMTEQLHLIHDSKLDRHLQLHILCHGDPKSFLWLPSFVDSYGIKNIKVEYSRSDTKEYEFPSLMKLQSFCDNLVYDSNILYFHHKGAYSNEHWHRHLLEYWTLTEWKKCVEKLDEGFDVVGYRAGLNCRTKKQWVPGNFWWAKSSFIQKLPRIILPSKDKLDVAPHINNIATPYHVRYQCELWIGKVDHKAYSMQPYKG